MKLFLAIVKGRDHTHRAQFCRPSGLRRPRGGALAPLAVPPCGGGPHCRVPTQNSGAMVASARRETTQRRARQHPSKEGHSAVSRIQWRPLCLSALRSRARCRSRAPPADAHVAQRRLCVRRTAAPREEMRCLCLTVATCCWVPHRWPLSLRCVALCAVLNSNCFLLSMVRTRWTATGPGLKLGLQTVVLAHGHFAAIGRVRQALTGRVMPPARGRCGQRKLPGRCWGSTRSICVRLVYICVHIFGGLRLSKCGALVINNTRENELRGSPAPELSKWTTAC